MKKKIIINEESPLDIQKTVDDQAAMSEIEISDRPLSDDTTEVPDNILPPEGPALFGTQDKSHRFFWHGKDINGNTYLGSGDSASQCNVDAGLLGSSTCHLTPNPDFIEPPVIAPPDPEPSPTTLNRFYNAGHADALRYFEDLKTLVLAWATEQNLSSGGYPDADALAFVIYARNNP